MMRVKAKVFELLDVILEETDESSRKLAVDVVKDYDIEHATESMVQIWETQQCLTDKEESEAKEALEKGLFHGYHTLRRLEDYQLC